MRVFPTSSIGVETFGVRRITCFAINRYKFDKVALEYAQKNYDLFMDDWRTNQHDNEQYHAAGGNGGGDTHYTWGALLCLAGLNQYIDQNPWDGLRFWSAESSIERKIPGGQMGWP